MARPDGTLVEQKSMLYLGGALDATDNLSSKLNRRLGLARSDVKNLERVWKHANMSHYRKFLISIPALVHKCCIVCIRPG